MTLVNSRSFVKKNLIGQDEEKPRAGRTRAWFFRPVAPGDPGRDSICHPPQLYRLSFLRHELSSTVLPSRFELGWRVETWLCLNCGHCRKVHLWVRVFFFILFMAGPFRWTGVVASSSSDRVWCGIKPIVEGPPSFKDKEGNLLLCAGLVLTDTAGRSHS